MEIKLHGLTKIFGNSKAVDIPSFSVTDGEMVGIVGNNGAGKTTLFRLVLDLIRADGGYVELSFRGRPGLEADCMAVDPAKTEIWKRFTGAYIGEGFLIDFLTPEEYFEFVAKANDMQAGEMTCAMQFFGDFLGNEILGTHKLIREFSQGNKQKIGIVSAMLARPQLLVLDEPFNFLDPSSQVALKHVITEYNCQTGATVLVSSHNLQHIVEVSTRVVLLEHGVILKDIANVDGNAKGELQSYFGK